MGNVQTVFGVTDFFIIRGFDSLSSGLVLTDGVAEPEATFYHLYNVERVEVLKDPGAFLYGGNPLSGSVNLTRKQPVFRNGANRLHCRHPREAHQHPSSELETAAQGSAIGLIKTAVASGSVPFPISTSTFDG